MPITLNKISLGFIKDEVLLLVAHMDIMTQYADTIALTSTQLTHVIRTNTPYPSFQKDKAPSVLTALVDI